MKNFFFFLLVLSMLAIGSCSVLAAPACTTLTKNLISGSTNSNSDRQVTSLQDFLHSAGYLASAPTGRYGAQTAAAVKKFQKAKGLSATGSVGPLTRAAIQKASCSSARSNSTLVAAAPPVSALPPVTPLPTPTLVPNLITMPPAGAQLVIGQKYPLGWTGTGNESIFDIFLETEKGEAAGFAAMSLSGTDHYDWTTGNVSIAGQSSAVIPPGNYRLRISNANYSGPAFNEQSGIFTIKESPLLISNLVPSSAPADGKTSVVLYGSGFTDLTRVHLAGLSDQVIYPQYLSPDGKLISFYVPSFLASGQYRVSVYNDYTSTGSNDATGTPSNYANLQVVPAAQ